MKNYSLVFFIALLFCGSGFAQTTSLNIEWDPNGDSDIFQYIVQRSVGSTNNFSQIGTVNHPTTIYVNSGLQAGSLYYYRVAAMDSSGNTSPYSPSVSAGLPQITLAISSIGIGNDTTIAKSSFLSDPDGSANALTLTFSNQSNCSVSEQGNDIVIAAPSASYSGPASFTVLAEDADGFADQRTISFNYSTTVFVFEVTIADVQFDEDGSHVLQLDPTVNSSNYTPADMTWSFSSGSDLSTSYNSSQRTVTITSTTPNWNGSGQITATATAPDQTTASATFTATINPVNDPPVASVPTLHITSDPNDNLIDLTQYAIDVDHSVSSLTWTFSGYNDFSITWFDQTNQIIRITQLNSATSETGTFTLTDPAGASDDVTVQIIVDDDPLGLFIVNVPNQSFNEDNSVTLALDNFVTVENFTAAQLTWSFVPGPDLSYTYTASSRQLTIRSDVGDWSGSNDFTVTATAPDQRTAADTFNVTINPVNDPPSISTNMLFISRNPDSSVIDLKNYAVDVDNSELELDWDWSGFSDFTIVWEDESDKLLRITPVNASVTQETGNFTVTDPGGLSDNVQMTLELLGNEPVFIVNAPPITFDEDLSYTVQMDTILTVSNYSPNQITWSFIPGPNLQYDYSIGSRKMTVESIAADWSGVDQVVAIATAPDQSTRLDTFAVTILPVNDPPVANMEDLFVSPFSNNLVDLKLYGSDVDNSDNDLTWTFWGFTDFVVSWQNQNNQIINITPVGNPTSQTGFFRVSDPQGAADTNMVTITYLQTNTPPAINLFSNLNIAEDSSYVIDLVTYIVDSTHTIGELTLNFVAGDNITAVYNSANFTLTVIPDNDWFGESYVDVTAIDPLGLSDTKRMTVNVERRNDIQSIAFQASGEGDLSVVVNTEIPSTLDFSYWNSPAQIITISLLNYQQQHTVQLFNLQGNSTYTFTLTVTDEDGRKVVIQDSTFTSDGNPVVADVSDVLVYPNPIKPSVGHQEMIFTNLPQNTRSIQLYSLIGKKIFDEELLSAQAQYRINLQENNDLALASGLYIYMVKDENSRILKSGKVVFIR